MNKIGKMLIGYSTIPGLNPRIDLIPKMNNYQLPSIYQGFLNNKDKTFTAERRIFLHQQRLYVKKNEYKIITPQLQLQRINHKSDSKRSPWIVMMGFFLLIAIVKKADEIISQNKKIEEEVKGKDVVLFLGSTGSGKSSLINFIHGCTMTKYKGDKVCVAKDSEIPEAAKAGHGASSFTTKLQLVENDLNCCDCPGFFDDRGLSANKKLAINIANAHNILKITENAKSIKIVLLIECATLMSERGKSLRLQLNCTCSRGKKIHLKIN